MGAAAGHGQGRPCPLPGPRGAQTGSRVRGSRHEERGAPGPWGGRELGPSGGGTVLLASGIDESSHHLGWRKERCMAE